MAFKNSFHLIGQGTPNVRYFFPVQKAKLASMLCDSSEDNLIYTRHMYYTDMTEMGCNVSYFNMVSIGQISNIDNAEHFADARPCRQVCIQV